MTTPTLTRPENSHKSHILTTVFILSLLFGSNVLAQHYLISDRTVNGVITIGDNTPGSDDRYAAAELTCYLQSIALPDASHKHTDLIHIYLGRTPQALKALGPQIGQLRDDGFVIHSDGANLYIVGNTSRATIYGTYHFLEKYLGCRFLTPNAEVVPHTANFQLPVIDEICNPSFAYRETLYYYPNHSDAYCLKHKLHNRNDLKKDWGMFVHTFRHLIPEQRYFDIHPEWFSEIGHQRVRDGQLCLSNPALLEELCRNLDSIMKLHPQQTIWSVSNNDNYNVCQCDRCRHLDSLYGGFSGTLVHFINQVARRFPDKTISTLGYQFTRKPPLPDCPEPQRPDSNVNIMFCSIECGRQEAIPNDPHEQSFRNDMEGWNRLTDNIFMWDYVVQFRNFWDPFPNLHVIQPNLKYFADHGVRMMFEQGSGEHNKTSWMELRTYLIAKLMWDTDQDADSIIHDFCLNYYQSAAPFIETFFRDCCHAAQASGRRLDIYGYPIDAVESYLQPQLIKHYQSLFDSAYKAIDGDSALADRIRYIELSLDYAVIELSLNNASPELSFFTDKEGQHLPDQAMRQRLDRFVDDCHRFGIVYLHEMGLSVDEYKHMADNYLSKCQASRSRHCRVTLGQPYDRRYPAGNNSNNLLDGQVLTDGVCGVLNYNHHWLGFYDKDLEATIDLGSISPIDDIRTDFYFFPLSWIFLPQEVEFYISSDSLHWEKVWSETIENPQLLATPEIHASQASNLGRKARWVKVVARRIPTIPAWHRACGNPCWLFTDEILIN